MQSSTERKFLIFESHEQLYAFDLVHVSEVSDPMPVWPVPLAPACCLGAVHIHGSIIAAMDLALFMGWPQCRNPEKMIVLSKEVAALSFLVARVIRIVAAQELEIQDTSDDGFTISTMALPEGMIMLLDVNKIVRAAENMMSGVPQYS